MGARTRYVAVLVLLLLAAAGVGGWLIHGGHDSPPSASTTTIKVGVPTIVTVHELEDYSAEHYPVYWAGNVPDTKIELTATARHGIFVRYLPKSAKAGDSRKYLTVATYSALDGYAALNSAKQKVAVVSHGQNGAVIVVFKERPLSTYFSFQNAAFQVEVFAPEVGRSKSLTDDGSIALVNGAAR
jgi:hypothetical protein